MTSGTATFNNIIVAKPNVGNSMFGGANMTGDFTVNTVGSLNGGWSLGGNLIYTAAAGGIGNITLNGTGAQTITQTGGTWTTGLLKINKTSGTATLASNVSTGGNFTVNNGTFSLNGNVLNVNASTGTMTVTGATSVLQCNGGCGAGTACSQGADLLCTTWSVSGGGTVTP